MRPFDAEGALAFIRGRNDVDAAHVFLQGWSNGGSTLLNVMTRQGSNDGFRGAGRPTRGGGKGGRRR